MKKFILQINCFLLFIMAGSLAVTHAQTPAYVQTFNNYFNNNLSTYNGNVVAIIGCRDRILYSYQGGTYNSNSTLQVQSLSKWVTSAVVMTLVEENKFALDDKVGQYIPTWNANGKQNITIRQLLSHTSGVIAESPYDSRSDINLAQAVDLIATNTSLLFTPGSQFSYGSAAYMVASRVAEVVENKPWKQIYAERLANVSGMTGTLFSPGSVDNPMTGHGLECSISQYSNFLKMILNYGVFNSTRVMDSVSVEAMQAKSSEDGAPFVTYGLGQYREQVVNGVAYEFFHVGVSGCLAWVDRTKNYYGIILSQAGFDQTYSTNQNFRALARENISNNECASGGGGAPDPGPCSFTDKQTIGTWTANNFPIQARQYTVNGTTQWLIVSADPTSTSNDKHFPRGANFVDRTDISWNNGAPSKTCFGGGDTGWDGLSIPGGITTPSGYIRDTTNDGAVFFRQSGGCTPPSAPSLSASPSTVTSGGNVVLSASGCSGGTITWSDGLGTGTAKTVVPTANKTYTATCSIGGCTSSNGSVSVTVTSGGGTSCTNLSSHVDGANCLAIEGWVYNSSTPNTPVNIDLYDGSTLIISNYPADHFRQDLLNAGMGNGNHAFEISTPSALQDGQSHTLTFKVSGCSYELDNSPKSLSGCNFNPLTLDPTVSSSTGSKTLAIFPNPANGVFNARFFISKGKKGVLTISDIQGKPLFRKTYSGTGMLNNEKISLPGKSSGTLLVQLHTERGMEVQKINIVR